LIISEWVIVHRDYDIVMAICALVLSLSKWCAQHARPGLFKAACPEPVEAARPDLYDPARDINVVEANEYAGCGNMPQSRPIKKQYNPARFLTGVWL
jgi:hypothetical protein